VVAVMVCSGRSTRPATTQPSTMATTAMMARAIPDWGHNIFSYHFPR
jgi:hypothetical protein